jgi:hypothetical protein
MQLFFSRHARNRMRRDGVSRELVESILTEPDLQEPSVNKRVNAWGRTSLGWCRVTYVDEGNQRTIVTVTIKRRGPHSH